jgi:hypothetical protein
MELSGQLHIPTALPRGKSPWYPLYRRLGGPQSRPGCCGEEKNLAHDVNRTPAVETVARHYTDWAIPTPFQYISLTYYIVAGPRQYNDSGFQAPRDSRPYILPNSSGSQQNPLAIF